MGLHLSISISRGELDRGARSALLYILVAETLAEAVREESQIKGIRLPDGLISKLVGYSDDGNATISYFKSVNKLFVLLEIYQRASGAKVNLQKTQGFLIGKLRYEKDTPLDIRWINEIIFFLEEMSYHQSKHCWIDSKPFYVVYWSTDEFIE